MPFLELSVNFFFDIQCLAEKLNCFLKQIVKRSLIVILDFLIFTLLLYSPLLDAHLKKYTWPFVSVLIA
jgi:hypothetical protein